VVWPFSKRRPDPEPEHGPVATRSITFQDLWGNGANFQDAWGAGWDTVSRGVSIDRALSLTPVYAATSLIADLISGCPIDIFRKSSDGSATELDPPPLLVNPTQFGTRVDWIHRCVISLALRGNAYGLITGRDRLGYPDQIEWLHPDDVTIDDPLTEGRPQWRHRGKPIDADLIVHIPYYTVPGYVLGLSPIKAYAAVIDTGLYAHYFGRDWFRNGSVPAGILKTDQRIDDETKADVIKARFKRDAARREPVVLGSGLDYKMISVAPNESQFLDTLRLTATQIAAIYHLHPEMIGGDQGRSASITYANVEQRAMETVKLALTPYMRRIEEALFKQLPGQQFVRFNMNAFIRADIKTRYDAHASALTNGWMSKDEVRAIEDLPPMPNGLGNFPKPEPTPAPGTAGPDGGPATAPSGPGTSGAGASSNTGAQPSSGGASPAPGRPSTNGRVPVGAGTGARRNGETLGGWDPLIALHGRRSDPWL
jgi:HK97 family phage portal protein